MCQVAGDWLNGRVRPYSNFHVMTIENARRYTAMINSWVHLVQLTRRHNIVSMQVSAVAFAVIDFCVRKLLVYESWVSVLYGPKYV